MPIQESLGFEGFKKQTFVFLHELAENNNKGWFEANRDTYIEALQKPAVALVEALGSVLTREFPPVSYDTRTNGSGSLMRMHRDTRFSADKSPYKTNIAMMFIPVGTKKMSAPGFGLQMSTRGVEIMAGAVQFGKGELLRYREQAQGTPSGTELEKAAAEVIAAGDYSLSGKTYKRVPRGFDENQARAEWLKYSGLYASAPILPVDAALDASLVETALSHFRAMSPIQQWLAKHVYGGASES